MKDFIEKFKIRELSIKEFDYWTVSLRPEQPTIGSLVLSLKRACPALGEMTREETGEMYLVFKFIEDMLRDKFSPDKINYLALMMVDEQVHFHVIPRYKNKVTFNSFMYEDSNWPKPPIISDTLEIDLNKLNIYLKD